jgi:hypothetical protein
VTVAGSAAAAPELLRLERQDSRATGHPHGDVKSGYTRHRAFYASLRMLPVFRTSQTYELLMAVRIRLAIERCIVNPKQLIQTRQDSHVTLLA